MQPISIHIPPHLRHLAIPPSKFYDTHPECERLIVGAFIFRQLPQGELAVLLVQRASSETGFPDAWEIPGGSAEDSDPTIFHSVAREVFEETGLHLTRVVRKVGEGISFTTRYKCLKLSFEIEVSEINYPSAKGVSMDEAGKVVPQNTSATDSSIAGEKDEVVITLDPMEHQKYAWVVEGDIREPGQSVDRLVFVAKDQQQTMLAAFESRRTAQNAWIEHIHEQPKT